jgi:hypothetical protein
MGRFLYVFPMFFLKNDQLIKRVFLLPEGLKMRLFLMKIFIENSLDFREIMNG